jgi:hypothetical protein
MSDHSDDNAIGALTCLDHVGVAKPLPVVGLTALLVHIFDTEPLAAGAVLVSLCGSEQDVVRQINNDT